MNVTESLVCAFGVPWLHHVTPPTGTGLGCLLCAAEEERLLAVFDAGVASGTHDAQGYTPSERRAHAKHTARAS